MQRLETTGGLTCRVVSHVPEAEKPAVIAIFCHGFGAPGSDLVMLAEELIHLRPALAERVMFVFPEGPLSLDEHGIRGGRAWWHIDVNRLVDAVARGNFRELRNDHPPGLPPARSLLSGLIQELAGRTGLPLSQFVLGGFSQGSMLATDVALHLPEQVGGLVVWSGTLLCEDEWTKLAAERGPLRVFQSHGYRDPILPYQGAEWLRKLFIDSGFEIDFFHFEGQHQIPGEAVLGCASLLQSVTGLSDGDEE